MDFKSMKRRELQALCKKHGLPANSTNSQMALSLASLLQKNEKIKLRGCLKGSDDSSRENLGPKKVSFSLEDEEFEFEKSLGIPERRRSARRASVGVIKADDRKTRVPEVPARITRSRALEVFHLTASQEDEHVQCDERKKRKESCVVEPNLRTLRSRVAIVSGNECELLGNQKLKRGPRRDTGKQKEDPKVDAFQNMKLGEGEVFEKKISRKRSRVSDVEEALPCNTDYGNTRPESAEVDAGAHFKETQGGGPPPRRSKRALLNTETMVFDIGAANKVEALPKRSTRSNVKCSVVESEISTVAKEKSGDESDPIGGKKQTKREGNRGIKSKAPAVSETACEFTTEASGQPEEPTEFRVPSLRMTCSSSKQVAMKVVSSLPTSDKLVNGIETARATRSRKKHGSRKTSENLSPSGETESVSKAVEVQVAHVEEVPLHPMQNTCKIGVAECEATEGFKQIDDVAREQDPIASPRIHAAVPKQKVVARRSTRNSTKNEALLTSAMQNAIPKEKVVARRSTRHSTKNEAILASVPQNVPVGVGKKGSTAKRAREAVPAKDATYVERDTSGGFPATRNQENGIIVDGNDKKPGSHVTNTRGSRCSRRVNSIDEAPEGEHSPDPPLSLLEDSCQDIFIGEGSASNVSSKSQPSQRLESIGKMSLDEQKNSENIHKRSGDGKLVDEHKCMKEGCSTHEDQVMISGSSEVMDVFETLETSPCSAFQDNCAQNVDEENISEVGNTVLVNPKHSSLSMHANGSIGPAETVTEAVGNPQMDTLLASEQSKRGFTVCTECVENVQQVNTAEVSHEFIDSESTSVAVADQCEMVVDVIHNSHNEDDPKHRELSNSVGGVSLPCEEIQEPTPAIGIEVSLGVDEEKFAMVADVPDAREISSHLTDISNDTHVNNSEDSSDQQSAPLKDIGTAEATLTTTLVFKSATETFGYVEEINEADKNMFGSCSGKLAFEESKETLVPDSENFSLSVRLQEDSAEFAGDQMKPSLLVDRLAAIQCAGVSPRETPKSLSCFEISHHGSSSHNHMMAIRPGARMHEDKEISASEYVVSLIVDKEACEVLDRLDVKNHSDMEGDCNAPLEEKFCEDSINLLPPNTGDLLEKRVEDIGMAAKDREFPLLSEDVDSEMKVMEKEVVLEVLDFSDAKNHSELEGDGNASFEERFCEVNIDPLSPTASDLLEKRDEGKGMVAKDIEFPLVSEDVVSKMKVMEKEAVLEVLDGRDAKNRSESEGDSNTSLEVRFCEATLPPTAGHLLDKRDENKEMATKDLEFPLLSENLAWKWR
ncbi:putative transcription regulator SAP family [Dioscorea sansibarensis]